MAKMANFIFCVCYHNFKREDLVPAFHELTDGWWGGSGKQMELERELLSLLKCPLGVGLVTASTLDKGWKGWLSGTLRLRWWWQVRIPGQARARASSKRDQDDFLSMVFKSKSKTLLGTSLVAQWLRIACQCRGDGFKPWSGKTPHAAEQLSPGATTTEPACHNYWSPRT